MNKHIALGVIVGLVVGFVVGGLYFKNDVGVADTHRMPDGSMMHDEMSDMMAGLSGKTGDEFDKAFLTEMIMHHEGAIEMAEAAKRNARHQEIQTMSDAIISAQTSEVAQMRAWLKAWYSIE